MKQKALKGNPEATFVWPAGFDLTLFNVPSVKTEVAQVTSALISVAFGAGDFADEEESATQGLIESDVLADWKKALSFESDEMARQVEWPPFTPERYRPSSSVEQRLEDNLRAIELMLELRSNPRMLNATERHELLKYCGWGGLARVFAPDGSTPNQWGIARKRLEDITTPEDFASMRASITSAYFTDPVLVDAIWSLVRRLGFQGGRIIEPTVGVGHFLAGMPADMAEKSDITAIEMDGVTAGIAQACFAPLGVQVLNSPLEKAQLPEAYYDLAIGNIPFGDHAALETKKVGYARFSIHNYCIAKCIDLVRPGGLVVLITTKQTMESESDVHRRWMDAHAELLGAIRLPRDAFKAQANTEVVTDVLVFRRRQTPVFKKSEWTQRGLADATMLKPGQSTHGPYRPRGGSSLREPKINAYYASHPGQVVGLLEWHSAKYGESLDPVFEGDADEFEVALSRRVQMFPEGIYKAAESEFMPQPKGTLTRIAADNYETPGSMVLRDGRIYVSEGQELLDLDSTFKGTVRQRVLGMMEIRDKAVAVVEFQANSEDDVQLAKLQAELNRTYDAFVGQCGYLSTTANSRVFRGDPSWPVLLALEVWDEENLCAHKADIFTKRTVGHRKVPEFVETVKDALLVSLALYGCLVIKDMSLRTRMPAKTVMRELAEQELAFKDPQTRKWVPRDEYLSGHIRDKIMVARAAGYENNVKALEAVLPSDLGPAEVEARLGASWIPCSVIEQFANELVAEQRGRIQVLFDGSSATWSMKCSGGWRLEDMGSRSLQTSRWGTERRSALVLLESALNQQPPTITMMVDERRVVDPVETMKAREKWQEIRDHFKYWVYQDSARRDALLRIYNDLFNQIVVRKFDGSHLQLQGMSMVVTPYAAQLDAIWRIVVGGNTLLAHCVGAGKTLIMCAAAMELLRLGKASKVICVTPNHCLMQFTSEFMRLYPQAKVLMATKHDLEGDKRRTFAARIACGAYDVVIMTHSSFERIAMSPMRQREFIRAALDEARMNLSLADDSGAKRSLKEIEKRLKDHEAKLENLADQAGKDVDNVWFDELGIDWVMLDEAHYVKNLARMSKMPRIAGLPNSASNRAFDFYQKSRYIMGLHEGRQEGLCLATATPLSNSLAEIFTWQKYLQPNTLKRLGIHEFDAWSACYGESVTGMELAPDGSGYRINTRYCRFVNAVELMNIFREVADIKTRKMLNLPTPKIAGGKPQTMVCQPSDALLAIVQDLVARAEKIKSGQVRPDQDNMLKVTTTGRKAALDVRLVDPSLPFDPNGKLAKACANMFKIWQESTAVLGTQMVFSDIGTPGGACFNVYAEVRRLLVAHGVPAHEIEFVHDHDTDAAKAKLWQRVRSGNVRFALGSTDKMGTGTNAQTRLVAIHQLDGPWRASDVEQRDGRGERPGNLNAEIALWRYVVEKSLDAYTWQTLDVKATFTEQFLSGDSSLRSVEDLGMTAMTYSEIKALASGNPMVLEKANVDMEVQRLGLKLRMFEDARWRNEHAIRHQEKRLNWIDTQLANIEKDAALALSITDQTVFKPATQLARSVVQGESHTARAIGLAFRAQAMRGELDASYTTIGHLGQFALEATRVFTEARLYVRTPVGLHEWGVARPHMNQVEDVGLSALATIQKIASWPQALRTEYGHHVSELAYLRKSVAATFEHADRLDALRKRQREIEVALDLDKALAGTHVLEES